MSKGSPHYSINRPNIIHYTLWALVGIIFLYALGSTYLYNDPFKCNSLLNDGSFLDSTEHRNWQPSSCMMKKYDTQSATSCLKNRRILFIGDSTIRALFYSLIKKIEPTINTTSQPKHSDLHFTFNEITFDFRWDPYLNSNSTDILLGKSHERSRGLFGKKPSILVMGSGLWYLRHRGSGGINGWKKNIDKIFDVIASSPKAYFSIADAIFFAPVEYLVHEKLSPTRAITMSDEDIYKMNEYLKVKQKEKDLLDVPFVFNKIIEEAREETEDGLHYSDEIINIQADILLNYRCNDLLPKKAPMSNTCCNRYPQMKWAQFSIFVVFLVLIPIGVYYKIFEYRSNRLLERIIPSESILFSLLTFGLAVIYMYWSDRTSLFSKSHKQYDVYHFTLLTILYLVGGIFSLKTKDKDQPFLNRDQTDEWKGWMQIAVLVYHYIGASRVSGIYNSIRILVASYLFMTGYGHFIFFYKKADFGLNRIVNVVVRLNLLTIVLTYVMDTDYLSYYFTPLTTFWFFVIYITMYIRSSRNNSMIFLLSKMALSCTIVYWIILKPGILENIFSFLEIIANINWNVKEWRFRIQLDIFIVYIGMLVGLILIKFQEYKITEKKYWTTIKRYSIIISAIVMIWFLHFEITRENKFKYNEYHPYISFLPIISFIILRNSTQYLRNTTSGLFTFIGKCSLETFIGQFHMLLAADTKGLLVLVGDGQWGFWWWINLFVASFIFIYICYYLAKSTSELTNWICRSIIITTTNIKGSDNSPDPNVIQVVDDDDNEKFENDNNSLNSIINLCENLLNNLKIRITLLIIIMWIVNLHYYKL
ncbi:10 TM acyl transferase domain found in Cas1p-domain-containing protein [Rhizophagus diaphanus]|nr:10 TM acyl transferase domain found in Cas1p-domain-containing protein [Rhizophagus diaphanus] [Rhizophagus sp. MUCL 43196]